MAASAEESPADPDQLSYTVEIAPTGHDGLDAALATASQLVSLREIAPTTGFGLVARAASDRERLARVLQAEGYWIGTIGIAIGGSPLDSPGLADRLTPGATVAVTVTPELGARTTIAAIAIEAATPEGQAAVTAIAGEPLGVAIGDPARIAPILAAEAMLRDRLLAAGYPLASILRRDTLLDYTTNSMALAWTLAPGPRARFAPPAISGTARVDAGFLARYAAQRLGGDIYSPQQMEAARRALMALGPFAAVRAELGTALTPAGEIPVTFVVAERPRRLIGGSLAYETNYGPSVSLFWEHRNLFGGAERLRLEGDISRIGQGGGFGGSTYRAFATLRDPGAFGRADLTVATTLGALRERLEAYDRNAAVGSALFELYRSRQLTLFAGPTLDIGASGPAGGSLVAYQVMGVTAGGRLDRSDNLLDPAKGWRLNGGLTPSFNAADNQPFTLLRVTATAYLDVTGDRRSILAGRTTFGSFLGANPLTVPIHMRFFAGGGGSVRGYDYQSIGPRSAVTGKPIGGGSLHEASLEWRQRLWGDFGAVAFVDAGTVGTGSTPDFESMRVGAGLGLRYYTAVGPIRADVALPLIKQVGSSGYGVYIGIGQSF
jgi:translocation and assembly module TamA